MTLLRQQLDKARAEKQMVDEQLGETKMLLVQEQREHKMLASARAREMELWTDEREKSLNIVEEMSKEVKNIPIIKFQKLPARINFGMLEQFSQRFTIYYLIYSSYPIG